MVIIDFLWKDILLVFIVLMILNVGGKIDVFIFGCIFIVNVIVRSIVYIVRI